MILHANGIGIDPFHSLELYNRKNDVGIKMVCDSKEKRIPLCCISL